MVTETNKFKRAWIWLWYNDATRLLILLGLPIVPVLAISIFLFGPGEYLRTVATITYIVFVGWTILDNDYTNLRRIGMNEYRKKIDTEVIDTNENSHSF